MNLVNRLHRAQKGQNALETAIILIAFIVVASVFAFAILSAGNASTERGQEAIYSGLEGVQSALAVRGDVVAEAAAAGGDVDSVTFTVSLASGGDSVDLTDTTGDNVVVISYRDTAQRVNELDWTAAFVGTNDGDVMLEANEIAEIKVDLTTLTTKLGKNTQFTLEVRPPKGAVLTINRTTPAAIEKVTLLR